MLNNCNDKDKCEGVNCLNGGTCVEGICNCPDRYTGQFCEKEIAPDSIQITKFVINGFPSSNQGNPWDIYDGPDLYVKIKEGTKEVYRFHKTVLNALDTKPYDMVPISSVTLDPNTEYTIELWDDDSEEGKNDQKIQTTTLFNPYRVNANFPDTIHAKSFIWDMDIIMYLKYFHN